MLGCFCWLAVVCAVQWSACPAVGCVGPQWPFGVGSGCSGCFGPAWHALVVHRPLHGAVCFGVAWPSSWWGVSWGGERFENWYDLPCPALEPALHAQPVILYIAVPFGFPSGLACADRMYTPVGGKAPLLLFGASPCSVWEPRGAVPAWWCRVRARVRWLVALVPSTGCRARCVPCDVVLRGSGGVCVGASVRLPEVRVVWRGGTPAFSIAWRFSGPPAFVATTSVL